METVKAKKEGKWSSGLPYNIFAHIVVPHIIEMIRLESELLFCHSCNVSALAESIGFSINMPDTDIETLRISGLIHDIGKIGVPDSVINKQDTLNPRESEIMRAHSIRGYEMIWDIFREKLCEGLKRLSRHNIEDCIICDNDDVFSPCTICNEFMEKIARVVRSHHELPDGGGYPDRLIGKQIPQVARVVAISDQLCALMEERPYRPAPFPKEVAIEKVLYEHDWGFTIRELQAIVDSLNKLDLKLFGDRTGSFYPREITEAD